MYPIRKVAVIIFIFSLLLTACSSKQTQTTQTSNNSADTDEYGKKFYYAKDLLSLQTDENFKIVDEFISSWYSGLNNTYVNSKISSWTKMGIIDTHNRNVKNGMYSKLSDGQKQIDEITQQLRNSPDNYKPAFDILDKMYDDYSMLRKNLIPNYNNYNVQSYNQYSNNMKSLSDDYKLQTKKLDDFLPTITKDKNEMYEEDARAKLTVQPKESNANTTTTSQEAQSNSSPWSSWSKNYQNSPTINSQEVAISDLKRLLGNNIEVDTDPTKLKSHDDFVITYDMKKYEVEIEENDSLPNNLPPYLLTDLASKKLYAIVGNELTPY
jgi:hypothetical protein